MPHRVMKVFDSTEMPIKMHHAFLGMWEEKCNDSMVEWTVGDMGDDPDTLSVDEWLQADGAIEFEKVIIKYWW